MSTKKDTMTDKRRIPSPSTKLSQTSKTSFLEGNLLLDLFYQHSFSFSEASEVRLKALIASHMDNPHVPVIAFT